jgi:hypothetical protein
MSASSARYVWDEESVGPGPRQLNQGGGHAILLAAALADLVGRGQLAHLPKEWQAEWAASREVQIDEARRRRGLR